MIDPASNGTLFMPPQASTVAPEIDALYYFIFYTCLICFVAIMGAGAYFVWKYRYRPGGPKAVPIHHNTPLEIAWSVIPLFILIGMFAWGYKGFLDLAVAPKDAMEIHVVAQRWQWIFEYSNGAKEIGLLRVPSHRPVKLLMTADGDPGGNVIHSFFVPDFRVKSDVLPNRYTSVWFEATREGTHQVFCTEYCGAGHSDMLAKVEVMPQAEFDEWLKKGGDPSEQQQKDVLFMAEKGKEKFQQICFACHAAAPGGAVIGPPLYKKFGTMEMLADGGQVQIDENYMRESILTPNAKIVKGYPSPSPMPPFQGVLKDWQVRALIEYIKTLK